MPDFSPRYLAEHILLPQFLKEREAPEVFAAFARRDPTFFEVVWFSAGFRFQPSLDFGAIDGLQVGLMSLPNPRDATEAYLAVVVGTISDPTLLRYFLWEKGEGSTFITERQSAKHINFGVGPPFTGDWDSDCKLVVAKISEIVSEAPTG